MKLLTVTLLFFGIAITGYSQKTLISGGTESGPIEKTVFESEKPRLTNENEELTDIQREISELNVDLKTLKTSGKSEPEVKSEAKYIEEDILSLKKEYCNFAKANIEMLTREEQLLFEQYSKDI